MVSVTQPGGQVLVTAAAQGSSVTLWSPPEKAADPSAAIIWLIAVGTVALSAMWAGADFRDELMVFATPQVRLSLPGTPHMCFCMLATNAAASCQLVTEVTVHSLQQHVRKGVRYKCLLVTGAWRSWVWQQDAERGFDSHRLNRSGLCRGVVSHVASDVLFPHKGLFCGASEPLCLETCLFLMAGALMLAPAAGRDVMSCNVLDCASSQACTGMKCTSIQASAPWSTPPARPAIILAWVCPTC